MIRNLFWWVAQWFDCLISLWIIRFLLFRKRIYWWTYFDLAFFYNPVCPLILFNDVRMTSRLRKLASKKLFYFPIRRPEICGETIGRGRFGWVWRYGLIENKCSQLLSDLFSPVLLPFNDLSCLLFTWFTCISRILSCSLSANISLCHSCSSFHYCCFSHSVSALQRDKLRNWCSERDKVKKPNFHIIWCFKISVFSKFLLFLISCSLWSMPRPIVQGSLMRNVCYW